MVRDVVKMKDIQFEKGLFENWMTGKIMDELLCSYKGLPKGVNYMVIGDPGVGKTTIILDLLSDLSMYNSAKVLFVSAEMNEIDLAIYVQRFPKFQNLDILFVEGEFEQEPHSCKTLERLTAILDQGWDVVAIDSFYELQGIIKEEENITLKKAESLLLSLMKQQSKGGNSKSINTTFLTIQQVTKSGAFVGSNRLKHSITAMMELRLENPKNIYSDRYAVFTKHRRGDVGVRLYYDLGSTGDVFYNEERYRNDQQIRRLQSNAANSIRNLADQFDLLFNSINTDTQ
jgi:predicted ATP-dependent serine protease